ncbi:MAG: YgiQ family radical SAM protein [Pseudomonadota bacterium]
MFLPTTREELQQLGWNRLDVVLVTGDSYIDSPYIGVSVIGKVLVQAGFRVGIIAQPDIHSNKDIGRLGEPLLFWGITGGCIDSMVANYTPTGKRRKTDDYTPGGHNHLRPDRAVITYANLIRRYFKPTAPLVLGGIEASLRRVTHYDFWSDSIRRSILFDAKADLLVYGMAEKTIVPLAEHLKSQTDFRNLTGICYINDVIPAGYIELPAYPVVAADKRAFTDMFKAFYCNNDPLSATGLAQRQDTRYWIQNPPASPLTQKELDAVHDLPFEHAQHPYYRKQGPVRALDTINFSILTHRGCYGECNFCAISVHQGRTVQWRSESSILAEAKRMSEHPDFKGYIQDVGGPTANMYGFECKKKLRSGGCHDRRCLFPKICDQLRVRHGKLTELLKKIREIHGIKKAFVRSGLRYDLILNDALEGRNFLKEIIYHHISGQLKVAPEHCQNNVLNYMGKPHIERFLSFKKMFDEISRSTDKKQYLTYYMIAAHPGCTFQDMQALATFSREKLQMIPEQIQIFTPTPSTFSSLMYWTGMDPESFAPLFVEKNPQNKDKQKMAVAKQPTTGSRYEKRKRTA